MSNYISWQTKSCHDNNFVVTGGTEHQMCLQVTCYGTRIVVMAITATRLKAGYTYISRVMSCGDLA